MKILHIGPLPAKPGITPGGIIAYMDGFLSTTLIKKYQFVFLNTSLSEGMQRNLILRAIKGLSNLIALIWILIRHRVRLAHIHFSVGKFGLGFWEKAALSVICRLFRVKVIFHLHDPGYENFFFVGSPFKKSISRHILGTADRIIMLSEKWKRMFSQIVNPKRLVVIPNAVLSHQFDLPQKKVSTEKVSILFMGSLGRRKGLFDLIEAAKILRNKSTIPFHINLYGYEEFPDEGKEVRLRIHEQQVEDLISFHGKTFGKEKVKAFSESDIFVLPTHADSFAIANLEAMAAGLPVISTTVGAIPEYLEPGINGFLMDPGDITSLVSYLEILIKDPEMRLKMGRNNLKKVRVEYDWEVIAKKVEALYTSLSYT